MGETVCQEGGKSHGPPPPPPPPNKSLSVCHFFSAEKVLSQQLTELESRKLPGGGGISDVKRVRRERDELKEAVKCFEAELTQIQADTKMLAEDRDNFKLLYEQVKRGDTLALEFAVMCLVSPYHQVSEEIARLRLQSHTASSGCPATTIRRIEGERDDAKLELHQLKIECRSLKERFKGAQDGHQRDLAGLEDRTAELKLQLDEVSCLTL